MTDKYVKEISANMERAKESVQAAKELVSGGHFDFAASRAYYAAFYAATAILLHNEIEFKKHSGIISTIHQKFVKIGKLESKFGKDLNWLFELRVVVETTESLCMYHNTMLKKLLRLLKHSYPK